jgi:S1-C subfamily serine protease
MAMGGQVRLGPEASPSPTATLSPFPLTSLASSAPTGSIEQVASAVTPAVVTVLVSDTASGGSGSGSGIIFNAAGWILTNRHVVSGASSVSVRLADGREFKATTYGIDTLTDLAIVRLDAPPPDLSVAVIGSSADLRPGQTAIAIGSPLGTFSGSVTSGIISALGRSITASGGLDGSSELLDGLIQTDAAINPGNSGGALVNLNGAVIGVNTATAASAQAIGFAIPIDFAKPLMTEALAGKPLARPYLGVRTVGLPAPDVPGAPSLTSGAWVNGGTSGPAVTSGSAAAKAGIASGDVIISLNGILVDAAHPLDLLLAAHAPGDQLTILVSRAGVNISLTAVLGTRPTG